MSKYKYNVKRSESINKEFLHGPIKCTELPKTVDLRSLCPPVYDQGDLGSCTANAGCAANSMRLARPDLMFSRLYLYYKERQLEGDIQDDGGAQISDIGKVLQEFGVCLEKEDPYDVGTFTATPTAEDDAEAAQYKISSYKSLSDIDHIKAYLATNKKPVLMGMDVYESFESDAVAATGKVPMPSRSEQCLGGHAVLIVGYIDGPAASSFFDRLFKKPSGCFIVRNSWGESWGDKGYFYLPYEYVLEKLAFDFWTIM